MFDFVRNRRTKYEEEEEVAEPGVISPGNNNNVIDVHYDEDSSSSSSSSWLNTLEIEEAAAAGNPMPQNHDPSSRGKKSFTTNAGSISNNSTNNDFVNKKIIREVRQIKLVIILVLLISIAGAIAVFIYTKNSEQDQFVNQFEDDANKVRNGILENSITTPPSV